MKATHSRDSKKPALDVGLKKSKLSVSEVAKAKLKITKLAHPGLRPCYIDMLSRRAVFHKKTGDRIWLQIELKSYLRRQLKHILHRQTEPAIKGEMLTKAIEKRLASNFEKQVRKEGFDPAFSQFFFIEQFQALQELYGKQCWYFLKRLSRNPGSISPLKAACLLSAARLIGEDRLRTEAHPIECIEKSEAFKGSDDKKTEFARLFSEKVLVST